MLLESFKEILIRLGDGSQILVVIFIYQDYALAKWRKKNKVEVGSSENFVTQWCTKQQSPERDEKFSRYFVHTLSLRLSSV